MEYATLIVLLALLQYVYFTIRVGASRGKHHVEAPSCEGDETWERLFRVQQNTLEQLVIMIPATYAFAYYVNAQWVLLPGAIFIFGRFLYSTEYLKDPKTRAPGMSLTLLANVILILGSLGAVLMGIF